YPEGMESGPHRSNGTRDIAQIARGGRLVDATPEAVRELAESAMLLSQGARSRERAGPRKPPLPLCPPLRTEPRCLLRRRPSVHGQRAHEPAYANVCSLAPNPALASQASHPFDQYRPCQPGATRPADAIASGKV